MLPADTLALMLHFDAVVYEGDLPILAFARRCAEDLPEPAATALIDGTRYILEGRTVLGLPAEISESLTDAADGFQAVTVLASTAGLTANDITAARERSRRDVAGSAFALEPPLGLPELLAEFPGLSVTVVDELGGAGVREVLQALGFVGRITVQFDRWVAGDPARILRVGSRWPFDLELAAARGESTLLVDRFGRSAGDPTMRITDLSGLAPAVRRWIGLHSAAARLPTPDGLPAEVPELVLAHLSDPHLTSTGVLYNDVLDPAADLAKVTAVLAAAKAAGRGPDVVVVSGDLTDSGDPDAYRRLDAALRPLAPTVIYATGNHDVRSVFHAELLGEPDRSGPILQVHRVNGVRIAVLDSTVLDFTGLDSAGIGAGHGVLTPEHLAELSAELAAPSPGGTVVVLHHAPLPPPSPLLTYFALDRASRSALADAVRGTDVRLILAGHHHLAGSGLLGGVPVAVAGSTAIRTDPLAPPGHERTQSASTFNLVRLYRDTFTVSVIPVDGAETVFHLDENGCAEVIQRATGGISSTDQHPSSR